MTAGLRLYISASMLLSELFMVYSESSTWEASSGFFMETYADIEYMPGFECIYFAFNATRRNVHFSLSVIDLSILFLTFVLSLLSFMSFFYRHTTMYAHLFCAAILHTYKYGSSSLCINYGINKWSVKIYLFWFFRLTDSFICSFYSCYGCCLCSGTIYLNMCFVKYSADIKTFFISAILLKSAASSNASFIPICCNAPLSSVS